MMQGFVNQHCEAIIRIAVGNADAPKQMVEAVIDTGFTGFLALPLSTVASLRLPWIFRNVGTLGDGSEVIFDMYRASVIWDGQIKVVDVAASETEPLVGMSLLYRFKVQIEAIEGGIVTVEALRQYVFTNRIDKNSINCTALAIAITVFNTTEIKLRQLVGYHPLK